jgi:hypothetical protein
MVGSPIEAGNKVRLMKSILLPHQSPTHKN